MLRMDAPVGLEVMAERQQTVFKSLLAREGHGYRASPRKKSILTTTRNRYEVRFALGRDPGPRNHYTVTPHGIL